ncbi:hypothetical protein [Marinagarivorans algicola]|uniref:hypothetical protein n=1 Tax=Marinagarivorans algicola TaxID=1513270 RepID=UPI003735917C
MKYVWAMATLLLSLLASANDNCPSDTVMATYRIEQHNASPASSVKNELILLRYNNNAVHINDKKMATQWTHLSGKHMKKTSYFMDDLRAIEYDVTPVSSEHAWRYHAQLLHPSFKERASLLTTKGSGCNMLEHYQQKTQAKTIDVWWYPHKQLVKRIESKQANQTVTWLLLDSVHDDAIVQQYFSELYAYQTTDFADIGDNESDPFFRKMINLGFVEHGATGFYDTNGNTLPAGNHSGHQH